MSEVLNKSGIYNIYCSVNNRRYVGQSVNIKNRLRFHKNALRKNEHPNVHLQNAWNKYKEKSFSYYSVLYCEKTELNYYEESIVNLYNKTELFNLGKIGNSFPMDKEVIERIASKQRGRTYSEEIKIRMREGRKNSTYKVSEETKKKLSLASKGRKPHINTILAIKAYKKPQGELCRFAVLKEEQVIYIRKCATEGDRLCDIVKQTGIPNSTIRSIIKGKTWSYLGPPIRLPRKTKRISLELDKMIRVYLKKGYKSMYIVKKLNVNLNAVMYRKRLMYFESSQI